MPGIHRCNLRWMQCSVCRLHRHKTRPTIDLWRIGKVFIQNIRVQGSKLFAQLFLNCLMVDAGIQHLVEFWHGDIV